MNIQAIEKPIRTFTLVALMGISIIAADPKISIFMASDVGAISKGEDLVVESNPTKLDNYLMVRNYFNLGYDNQLDENNFISVGVGGLFWHDYNREGEVSADRTIKFGPGVSQAFFRYNFTEDISLQFGYMPYKYNTPVKNLGEYLFRTEAYPTIVYTGGWGLMNFAFYRPVGAKFSWNVADGLFNQDFTFFMENFNSPVYDITPAYIFNIKPTSAFTLGGAVACHRCITPTPDTKDEITRPMTYIKDVPRTPRPTIADYRVTNTHPTTGEAFDITVPVTYTGPGPDMVALRNQVAADYQELGDAGIPPEAISLVEDDVTQEGVDSGTVFNGLVSDLETMDAAAFSSIDSAAIQTIEFNNSAIKLVGFFEFDIRALMGQDASSFPEFNIYGEVALLGTKNYPVYYTKTSERLISMLGLSIPVPLILDHLSFEIEYLKNPNIESIRQIYDELTIPPDDQYRYETFTEDDFKWSVHAAKKLGPAFTFYVQFANDHLRPQNGFGQPAFIPVTNKKDHWYWMTRLQWAY